MRGRPKEQKTMLTLKSAEHRIPKNHPLRFIKGFVDSLLDRLSPVFDEIYAEGGRPSIPPEWLLKASLLMAFYSIRSERLFCEQLSYNLLFQWFLDMEMDEDAFDHSTFSKNRQRLVEHDIAGEFFHLVVEEGKRLHLMSSEHFTVDGTLIEAWASLKSFRPKDEKPEDREPPDDPGNPTVDFHGEKRRNETHESKTDPESRLARKGKGKEAKLSFAQHVLMENRNGLVVDIRMTQANGFAEREAAVAMMHESLPGQRRITVGADKHYDTKDFVDDCRFRNITPHVAMNETNRRRSSIDGRTSRHESYRVSQRIRKKVEEVFGWMKTVGNFRKTRYRGVAKNQMISYFLGAAYNLVRMTKMLPGET